MQAWRACSVCLTLAIAALSSARLAAESSDHAPVLPSLTARSTRLDTSRPPEVPDDATLEASGATIGQVQFNNLRLFDIGGLDQDTALFRLANRLHIDTRQDTIAD